MTKETFQGSNPKLSGDGRSSQRIFCYTWRPQNKRSEFEITLAPPRKVKELIKTLNRDEQIHLIDFLTKLYSFDLAQMRWRYFECATHRLPVGLAAEMMCNFIRLGILLVKESATRYLDLRTDTVEWAYMRERILLADRKRICVCHRKRGKIPELNRVSDVVADGEYTAEISRWNTVCCANPDCFVSEWHPCCANELVDEPFFRNQRGGHLRAVPKDNPDDWICVVCHFLGDKMGPEVEERQGTEEERAETIQESSLKIDNGTKSRTKLTRLKINAPEASTINNSDSHPGASSSTRSTK